MSKYTTEVRFICETAAGLEQSGSYYDIATILAAARTSIFDFDYPIFDSNYKATLETKILRHYYTREICEETVGLWKLRLQDSMNIIMPYYNKLYESELLKFNPLYDVDIKQTHAGQKNDSHNETKNENRNYSDVINREKTNSERGNEENSTAKNNFGTNKSNATSDQKTVDSSGDYRVDKYSDAPQGTVSNLANDTYLTNARIVNNDNVCSAFLYNGCFFNSLENFSTISTPKSSALSSSFPYLG